MLRNQLKSASGFISPVPLAEFALAQLRRRSNAQAGQGGFVGIDAQANEPAQQRIGVGRDVGRLDELLIAHWLNSHSG